ncbi:MAG: FHA domain-containing protein [Deltaproteobacteria bacterium]|jgi:pSer/pThr/pTyr-binding forkhead associated (FHA) protein|nr:FHA domain-containing protein [Deltaproteobacteria bacterium]MCW8891767.1 FHA domain-containing protein [Deltaproteobacteria bacterium]MCW9049632.1 FHA domain-containing protein [Deltaproteobacteria bacterium]
MLKIELLYLGKVLATFETENELISVGRSSKNDIQIDNLAVSSAHATIKKVMNAYFIEDLGSTNGTFVNEKKVAKYELLDGDEVIIGKHSLVFHYLTGATNKQTDLDKTMVLDTRKQKELLKKNC